MKQTRTQKIQNVISWALKTTSQSENKAPHCTNPKCIHYYHSDPSDTSWRKDHGFYETKAFGTVPRYRCMNCGKTFSDQSFSMDYYVKQPVEYLPLIQALVSTSGQNNLARFTALRVELIQNRYERLARAFLALHSHLRKMLPARENFVLDGFESFSRSQYYPNNINILVGSASEYIYGIGFSQIRRKGAMTPEQILRRNMEEEEYGKAPPDAVEMSVASLLCDLGKLLHKKKIGKRILYTDKHYAYPKALERIIDSDKYFHHETISSRKARTYTNPLFPVNYVDRQFRKDLANHVRESVQFARCPSAMMLRLSIYQMYHNYIIARRVKRQRKGDWTTRGE